MADHIIALNSVEEAIYQKYLSKTGKTDATMMAGLKQTLSDQVVQTINEAGHAKFNSLSVVDKIAFIG